MGRPTVPFWLAIGLLAVTLLTVRLLPFGRDGMLPDSLETFPSTLGEWRAVAQNAWEPPARPQTASETLVRTYVIRTYVNGREPAVFLYISYWKRQQPGEVAFTAKHIDPRRGWAFVREDQARIPAVSRWGPDLMVTRALYERRGEAQLISYWFIQPGRRAIGSRYWGRAYMIWDYLTQFRSDVAMIRVASPASGGDSFAGFEAHKAFIRDALPALEQYFGS